jgi:hypothetical protein
VLFPHLGFESRHRHPPPDLCRWAEGARLLLTAVAQHRTSSFLATRYGTEQFDVAEDGKGVNGDSVLNREDISWVHLHSGRHVLGWFAASASPRLTGAAPILPEIMLAPAAAAASAPDLQLRATGAGDAGSAAARSKIGGWAGGDTGGTYSATLHAPDLLYRAVDAYEYARQVRFDGRRLVRDFVHA